MSLNCESSLHDSLCICADFLYSMFISIWNMYRGMRDSLGLLNANLKIYQNFKIHEEPVLNS